MTLYKFLDAHDRGPFTGAPWRIDEWVQTDRAVACADGVHGFRARDISHWLAASLWELELVGELHESRHKVVGSMGRLVRRIDDFPAAARELAAIGAWRSRDRAPAALDTAGQDELVRVFDAAETMDDLMALADRTDDESHASMMAALATDAAYFAVHGDHAQSPFVAACSAGHAAAGPDGHQPAFDAGYQRERRFQSQWLIDRLGLS